MGQAFGSVGLVGSQLRGRLKSGALKACILLKGFPGGAGIKIPDIVIGAYGHTTQNVRRGKAHKRNHRTLVATQGGVGGPISEEGGHNESSEPKGDPVMELIGSQNLETTNATKMQVEKQPQKINTALSSNQGQKKVKIGEIPAREKKESSLLSKGDPNYQEMAQAFSPFSDSLEKHYQPQGKLSYHTL